MIALDHVGVVLGGQRILQDVSLRVPVGAAVCLFGPSGCGKTTVLQVVSGLVRPDTGSVRVGASRLAYAFQDDRLAPWLTVEENLVLALSGHMDESTARDRAARWLGRLGLAEATGKRPGSLSGGMRRRTNLARALALQPDLLLLDEPFAFLDSAMVGVVKDILLELRETHGTTMLIVSHVREHASGLGAEIVPVSGPPVSLVYPSGTH
jgi:NitT/TauT family transport system ATP-binding protein